MEGEPGNAASEMTRFIVPRLSEAAFLDEWPDRATATFSMEDRRRFVGLPTADGYTFMQRQRALLELGEGTPTYSVREVIAVRGERFALVCARTWYPQQEFHSDSLILIVYDRAVLRIERVIQFDEDDVEAAIAALDRLESESEAEEPPTR